MVAGAAEGAGCGSNKRKVKLCDTMEMIINQLSFQGAAWTTQTAATCPQTQRQHTCGVCAFGPTA